MSRGRKNWDQATQVGTRAGTNCGSPNHLNMIIIDRSLYVNEGLPVGVPALHLSQSSKLQWHAIALQDIDSPGLPTPTSMILAGPPAVTARLI